MKYILYGAGKACENYYKCFLQACSENDISIVDSNPALWNKRKILGKIVESPIVLKINSFDRIFITSQKYSDEISKMLIQKYNIPEDKIEKYNTIRYIDPNTYNIGNMEFLQNTTKQLVSNKKEFSAMINPNSMNDLEKFVFFENKKHLTKWIHYFEQYDHFFSKFRNRSVTILEIGVYKGGSLEMWKNYFQSSKNAVKIYGIDINPSCKQFEEENIHILIGSQEDRNFLRKVKKQIGSVDIIIDDGGHTMNQQIVSFEELFDLLTEGGIYVCEDLHTSYWKEYGGNLNEKNSFIEYSKTLIDYLNVQHIHKTDGTTLPPCFKENIKSLSYYDSMVFIEKAVHKTSFDFLF